MNKKIYMDDTQRINNVHITVVNIIGWLKSAWLMEEAKGLFIESQDHS